MPYVAPVQDLKFALMEAAGFPALAACDAFRDVDFDTVQAVLEGAGSLAENVLAPINWSGDRSGVRLENGRVFAAPGFAEAYREFAQGGWSSLAASPAYGGQGLPKALELAVFEMLQGANMSFALCPMLTQGAIDALHAHGADWQKALYLPKMISGEWTGTMNLTEPQAGSDLSMVRASATPDGHGAYRIKGQKIFITWGDHDIAENIVHLVLARLPDAPEGVRGISLFLVPKFIPDADGKPGEQNAVRAGGVEHKLGIHASPTCTMLFEEAKGWLVGEAHKGLPQMFTMMNSARLNVGMQGVGIAERAYQQALAFALERRQGRAVFSAEAPGLIYDHPDIRRMLLLMRAKINSARAICLATAVCADLAGHAPDEATRTAAALRQDLLVPIAKAWSTDIGVEVASMGVQIHGGMGFVEETGAAQHYRDARIAPIYEGTNGIQAIDLMGRKLGQGGGSAMRSLIADMRATALSLSGHANPWLHGPGARLASAANSVERAGAWMIERRGHAQPDALAGATPFLKHLAEAAGGWMLGRGALGAANLMASGDATAPKDRLAMRLALLRVYGEHVLAALPAQEAAVTMGALDLQRTSGAALASR